VKRIAHQRRKRQGRNRPGDEHTLAGRWLGPALGPSPSSSRSLGRRLPEPHSRAGGCTSSRPPDPATPSKVGAWLQRAASGPEHHEAVLPLLDQPRLTPVGGAPRRFPAFSGLAGGAGGAQLNELDLPWPVGQGPTWSGPPAGRVFRDQPCRGGEGYGDQLRALRWPAAASSSRSMDPDLAPPPIPAARNAGGGRLEGNCSAARWAGQHPGRGRSTMARRHGGADGRQHYLLQAISTWWPWIATALAAAWLPRPSNTSVATSTCSAGVPPPGPRWWLVPIPGMLGLKRLIWPARSTRHLLREGRMTSSPILQLITPVPSWLGPLARRLGPCAAPALTASQPDPRLCAS